MLRGNTISHRDWLAANEARHKMRWKWAEFFKEYDLLLCPAAASAAFPHDHVGRAPRADHRGQRPPRAHHRPALLGRLLGHGVPAVARWRPAGFTQAGLPVGVQIIGPQYGDRTCIQMARLLERDYQAFVAPPSYA